MLKSITTHSGINDFNKSWFIYYLGTPFIGAGMSLGLYFSMRAGIANGSTNNLNLYGVTAISFLAGLFSNSAFTKLNTIFDTIVFNKKENSNSDTENQS